MTQHRVNEKRGWLAAHPMLPGFIITTLIGGATTYSILSTAGEPAVPLDDTFIHFQYAVAFSKGQFAYSPGTEAAAGATSLLWPLILAVFVKLGLSGVSLIWPAWIIGWLCLALLIHETRLLATGLTSNTGAWLSGLLVPAFGGYVWCAGSGMEVLPFSWLLVRSARRSAELGEGRISVPVWELCILGLLSPLMRPEGVLASLTTAVTLLVFSRGQRRLWGFIPLFGPLIPGLVNWVATGQSLSTTAQVKWLLESPYSYGGRIPATVLENIGTLFGTLLNGELWSSIFLPRGGFIVGWLALASLPIAAGRTGRWWRGGIVTVVALGMLIPTSYDSFLWNRLRYLWPFAAGWLIGLITLSETIERAVGDRLPRLSLGLGGVWIGALATKLSPTIDDLATSANAIRRQQVDLGRWAAKHLPANARIGVNDTGAIAYFSGHSVFDIVGLTTPGEAVYWRAGAGARFEHYEKVHRQALPTHFIVYPGWLAMPSLLGDYLTHRTVDDSTILGGQTMVAHVASYETLGSGTLPSTPPDANLLDELDVADLESETKHAYELFWATQHTCVVIEANGVVDGGRTSRTVERFSLRLVPGGVLVVRLGADDPVLLRVLIDGQAVENIHLREEATMEESALRIPSDIQPGEHTVEVRAAASRSFTALHYWSYGKPRADTHESSGTP